MNDCTTVHAAYWKEIHVEHMLKRSYLGKVMPQDGQLPQITTNHHIEEPVAEDIQSEKLEEYASMGNGDIQAAREEPSVVKIPHINSHIDFVFGDQQCKLGDDLRIVRDYDLMCMFYK